MPCLIKPEEVMPLPEPDMGRVYAPNLMYLELVETHSQAPSASSLINHHLHVPPSRYYCIYIGLVLCMCNEAPSPLNTRQVNSEVKLSKNLEGLACCKSATNILSQVVIRSGSGANIGTMGMKCYEKVPLAGIANGAFS